MKFSRSFTFAITIISLLFAGACSRSVTRVDPNTTIDLSGRWNDSDSKQVSKDMISDVMSRPWLPNFENANNKRPVVIVGGFINKSHEHIEAETFIKDIEREFINSGKVRVVENDQFREQIRAEQQSQQANASEETQKKIAQELGADFIMFGTINSTVDELGKEKVVNYKVNLELADLESTEKVWIGDKEIKKYIKN
ncbi:penicillin-binding protein activator LpoB [Flammeovirga sp. OC4]|uniref:penicillin-binding protein activator LpoB n=1 Tax=Flammeovirga sp. OC4 TaxID=1382345 RepID=UPI0005C6AA4D|nr:penicillin-binding protein activator LpoB [Flammeovirga sp. OC4]